MGFQSNPDDLCVMNKMFGEHQMTVVLHVDNLKVSCVDRKAIYNVLDDLKGINWVTWD